jgi:HD superfamily phosphohydrolase YqeK
LRWQQQRRQLLKSQKINQIVEEEGESKWHSKAGRRLVKTTTNSKMAAPEKFG